MNKNMKSVYFSITFSQLKNNLFPKKQKVSPGKMDKRVFKCL